MSDPERPFDAWAELKFAIRELQQLAGTLGSVLGADDDSAQTATWDAQQLAALDLLQRTYADIGTLSAQYLRTWCRCSSPSVFAPPTAPGPGCDICRRLRRRG